MPLPTPTDSQIDWIVQQVAAYIASQNDLYRGRAASLTAKQRNTLQPFFPASALPSTRLVELSGERVGNPPFYPELFKMGFPAESLPDFRGMAAITFVDVVVSHGPITDGILFHELVHVVQYQKLGVLQFASKYVRGFLSGGSYEAIPLERNAYELDGRFTTAPASPFSVEVEVDEWIRAARF